VDSVPAELRKSLSNVADLREVGIGQQQQQQLIQSELDSLKAAKNLTIL